MAAEPESTGRIGIIENDGTGTVSTSVFADYRHCFGIVILALSCRRGCNRKSL